MEGGAVTWGLACAAQWSVSNESLTERALLPTAATANTSLHHSLIVVSRLILAVSAPAFASLTTQRGTFLLLCHVSIWPHWHTLVRDKVGTKRYKKTTTFC